MHYYISVPCLLLSPLSSLYILNIFLLLWTWRRRCYHIATCLAFCLLSGDGHSSPADADHTCRASGMLSAMTGGQTGGYRAAERPKQR
ncbi:hypothetical protein NPIL_264101 [Nephila pilipes]|uniref:Uncharacterized protein n=1 Tax=Nephila pilipes TaxID=299642 RepID=A0A8X6PGT0_NEPPI|nr:hypothetical protein NPIL_264101 [Nephila pilipes]